MAAHTVKAALYSACFIFILHTGHADLHGRCPTEASCPARATPCNSNSDCEGNVCCDTTCGKACIEPLFTGCENLQLSSERISRALSAEGRDGRAIRLRSPRCRVTDGEFEEIQCDNEIVSSCWCVDEAGFEVAGTRAPAAGLVNCTRAAACAAHTCRMLCPLGFELDSKGCPLCKCRDPCTTVTCPGQTTCQLEEVACVRPPCPPVPTCKRGRSLQNICPAGEPLLISETARPFLCGTDPGKPNCPPLYKCLVESGNDYGVCCPASLELQKAGTCPATNEECGTPCAHDLECPSMQKCCDGGECGRHCTLPHNVTICTQQKMLAELLVISEMEGRGYVPQCKEDGGFEARQCSRNGLVCWCVDSEGNKLRGSMGPASTIQCQPVPALRLGARSLGGCTKSLCASVCEYGYKTGLDGCPSCECDDPCGGYPCPKDHECVRVTDAKCDGELCTGYPICRPRISYDNPCSFGTPADDEGTVKGCGADEDCPSMHVCTQTRTSEGSVCCPRESDDEVEYAPTYQSCGEETEALCAHNSTESCPDGTCAGDLVCCSSSCGPLCVDPAKMRLQSDRVDDTPTMCEYLRDFDEKMEGTVDGMKLALPAPSCLDDGSYTSKQCVGERCWCVDSFGTEIPKTSSTNDTLDCDKIREELSCLEMTCRMGCDYGFELGPERCPTCRCRDPCTGVQCPTGRACAVVDVACDADYCPPVPACLPRKPGQCPYLVPTNGACEWSCRSDAECGLDERCCATGCGTACARADHSTPCQQRRALALHRAAENGEFPVSGWIPACSNNGDYERVQCRVADKKCWCVDSVGNEIAGSRSTNTTPACDAPSPCPATECDISCPHGIQLDNKGCPTCSCYDPCTEAQCKDNETCELVQIDCEGESCLPLARCAPSPACPSGAPLPAPQGSGPLICGPTAAACPSSHACRFAPHDSATPVCCPKPRTVCFDGKEEGVCTNQNGINATRWYFNHEKNRCERFTYQGCSGNHNNFKTKEECNSVCPVLSPCERLKEKNELAAQKYGKGTFVPECDATGAWEAVQCMQHIDVCWCVSARGEPLKGSLVRGSKPTCNFRQARKWTRRDPLDDKQKADDILEELIRQMTAYRVDDFEEEEDSNIEIELGRDEKATVLNAPEEAVTIFEIVEPKIAAVSDEKEEVVEVSTEKVVFRSKCQSMQEEVENGAEGMRPRCLADGSFAPRQCNRGRCWCVDAAGQRRPHASVIPDLPDPDPCEPTQIESASLELELVGVDAAVAERSRATLAARLAAIGARVPVVVSRDKSVVRLRTILNGPRGVDYVFHIENMVKREKLDGIDRIKSNGVLGADMIRSEYRLAAPIPSMQQREILTESTVSATTSYHTALIVLAATSAFVISVLCVLVMLYRARLQREPHKAERFLPAAPPVYVLSADEKAELARALHAPPPPVPPPDCDLKV